MSKEAFADTPESIAVQTLLAAKNIRWRIENLLWIQDIDGRERPIGRLKPGQVKLHNLLEWFRTANLPARILVAKDRKVGVSTYVQGRQYLEVIDHGYQALTVAHDKASSEYLTEMAGRFHDYYCLDKPSLRKRSVKGLQFDVGSIEVHTANRTESTRSRTPQFIHGSEAAYWIHGNTAAIAIAQAIGRRPATTLIYETTANSFDPFFQPMWENASECCQLTFSDQLVPEVTISEPSRWNGFVPLFLSVTENEDKRVGFTSEAQRELFRASLTADERRLLEQRGLPLEYIHYRRLTIAETCQGRIEIYLQEHPESADTMFRQTGQSRLDQAALSAMIIEDGQRGVVARVESAWDRPLQFRKDNASLLTVFRPPLPYHHYVCGVDMSTGQSNEKGDQDATVAILFDLDSVWIEQVATIAGPLNSEELYPLLISVAEYYNWPYLVPETSFADYLITKLTHTYPVDLLYRRDSRQVGFATHRGTRNRLIDELASRISARQVMLHDRRTVRECQALEHGRWRVEAAKRSHDDHCFASALAFIGIDCYPASRRLLTGNPRQNWRGRFDLAGQKQPRFDGYGNPGDI